jgi:Ca2+-binding EF-hand superfamily protein
LLGRARALSVSCLVAKEAKERLNAVTSARKRTQLHAAHPAVRAMASEQEEPVEDDEQYDDDEDHEEEDQADVEEPSRPHTAGGGLVELKKAKKKKDKEARMYEGTREEEADLKLRVNKLRAELLKSTVKTAMHRSAMYHLHMADAEKEDMKSRKGLDNLRKQDRIVQKCAIATEDELKKLSTILRKHHERAVGNLDSEVMSWFGLFKRYDDNNDNHISLVELKNMIRLTLRVSPSAVTDRQLHGAWRALDTDQDGLIDAGAFGRFYRRADIIKERKLLADRRKFVDEQVRHGIAAVPPMYVGIVGDVAKDSHWRSRAKLEIRAVTPMQESRIEASKRAER